MRTRTKVTYQEAVTWMAKNIYFPGAEDRGLVDHVCVQFMATIFRRKPMDVAKEIYLTYVELTTSEKHKRRQGLTLMKGEEA